MTKQDFLFSKIWSTSTRICSWVASIQQRVFVVRTDYITTLLHHVHMCNPYTFRHKSSFTSGLSGRARFPPPSGTLHVFTSDKEGGHIGEAESLEYIIEEANRLRKDFLGIFPYHSGDFRSNIKPLRHHVICF